MKLGFIGTGNLATAILRGVVASETVKASEILIFDINQTKLEELSEELSVASAKSANEIASECENIIIAVKPKDLFQRQRVLRLQKSQIVSALMSKQSESCPISMPQSVRQ